MNRHKKAALYDLVVWLVTAILIGILMFIGGCSPKMTISNPSAQEYAYYEGRDIYWVNQRGEVFRLNWSDIRALGIDSLRVQFLDRNAEVLDEF